VKDLNNQIAAGRFDKRYSNTTIVMCKNLPKLNKYYDEKIANKYCVLKSK